MNKKTVILHVGTYKTGTTSIQDFMCANESQLRKAGWFIPTSGRSGSAHHYLIWSLMGRPDAPPADSLFNDLCSEIRHCKQNNILISTELMFNCAEVPKLLNYLQEFDVKIVVYLRRQDEFISSYYAQLIKHPRFREKLHPSDSNAAQKGYMDYLNILNFWEESISRDKIIVRPFEKSQLSNGVISDFLKILGLDSNNFPTIKSTNSNVTLPIELLEYLRISNGLEFSEYEHNQLISALEKITMMDRGTFTHQNLFSPEVRIEMLKSCEKDNKIIAERYLGSGKLLFTSPPPIKDEAWSQPNLTLESLTRIMIGLWSLQERESVLNSTVVKLRKLFN